jgi:hypothetical protein
MRRETRSKIVEVVTMGAICLMAASPAVAQTDRSSSGAAGSPGRPAEAMPGSGTQRMERSAYPSPSTPSGATTMTGDTTSTDLRGLPDPPETVRRAQKILQSEGFDPGPINGVLGEKTEEALLQYQQKHGIEATGWLDRETRAKLGV